MQTVDPTFGSVLFGFLTTLITIGFVGNILSFVTWSTGKRCRHLPVSSYLKPLAIVDTCILLFPAIELLVYLSPAHLLIREVNIVFCKLFPFAINSSLRYSAWIVVLLSLEKVLHVYMPFKFPYKRNNTRVPWVITLLGVVSYGIAIPFLVDFSILSMKGNNNTTNESIKIVSRTGKDSLAEVSGDAVRVIPYTCALKPGSFTITKYLRWESVFNAISLFAIPFVVLLVCNVLILMKMIKRSSSMPGMVTIQQRALRQIQFKHATYQVVALSFVQCISTFPISLINLNILVNPQKGNWVTTEYFFELYYLFNCLTYLNSAVNFILYCSIGNDFRQDFIDLFRRFRSCLNDI